MTDNNTRQQTLLDQYWDADRANRAYIPAELDASLRETVDQFHAADDAPAPDREFVDRLWTDLAGDVPEASIATPPWTDDPDDEPIEPQYVPNRKGNSMQARPQSIWKRRSRQILEMVAGVLVLALITGGLILAYQNLIGEGEGQIPGAGDEMGNMVPSLSSAGAIPWDGDTLQRDGIGSVEIGRFDDQDYAFIFTVPGTQSGMDSGPELRVVRLDQTGQHEQVGSLELDLPWTSSISVAMGTMALVDDVLYLPVPAEERPGIWAVDIADPAIPDEVAFLDVGEGFPTSIASSDTGMLAATTFDGPMYFVDVSDRTEPDIMVAWDADFLGYYETVESPSIAFHDDYLYIARFDGLSVIDFSEPADLGSMNIVENPDFDPSGDGSTNGSSLRGPIPGDAWHDVLVIDDTAYIAAGDDGVLIFDVSDPTAPTEIGQIERDDRTFRLAKTDGFVYVLGVSAYDEPDQQGLDWTWSVDVLDVSDRKTPKIVGRPLDLSGGAEDEDFLHVNTRHLVAGTDFLLTFGSSGSLVAHINWVEPADDEVAREEDISDFDSDELGLDQEFIEGFQEEVERNREIIENFEPERVIDVDETLEYEGEEIRVVAVELSPEATMVTIEQDRDQSLSPLIGPGYSVRFPDGSEHRPFSGGGGTRPEGEFFVGEHFFPPAPEGAKSIELVFHSFLVSDDEPIEVTFRVPDGLADAELAPDETGPRTFPVDHAFEVEGQALDVVYVTTAANIGEDWFTIVIENPQLQPPDFVEPDWPETEGLIQFTARGSASDWITLVDDTGQQYEHSAQVSYLGPDGMVVGFDGPINPEATEFTLRSERRGVQAQPFEPLEISLIDDNSGIQPAIDTDDVTVYFPRQAEDPGIDYNDVPAPGELVLDEEGCLHLDVDGPVVIWPHTGFSIELIDGAVTLLDENANPITRAGEEINLHGSPIPGTALDSVMLKEPLPDACSDSDEYHVTGPEIGTP